MNAATSDTMASTIARMSRVETTLLLLMSVDGKITSGESDALDSDRDWKRIRGVKEGLPQYYQTEWSIAVNSLNTGRVMAKIGINSRTMAPEKDDRLTFVIVDRKPHLNETGVRYLAQWVGKLYVVTNNPSHLLIVMAPLIVGGRATSSLVDGPSLQTEEDLVNLKALKLVRCEVLEHSYLRLAYDVINETIIDPRIE